MTAPDNGPDAARALLAWYVAMGADEAHDATPPDRQARPAARLPADTPRHATPVFDDAPPWEVPPYDEAAPERPVGAGPMEAARARRAATPAPVAKGPMPAEALAAAALAADCSSLEALEAAIRGFEGCGLKATAIRTVFADGNPEAPVMIIGEAPGADEDRIGRPFVGAAGKLLDRMLAAIGLDRSSVYITNVTYWRPPGNRTPTAEEIAICRPFVTRHIELARPRLLVLSGNTSARTLLDRTDGITRLRGRWYDFQATAGAPVIPALATYHPSYLLRSPGQKRAAWNDFLSLKNKL
jgi:DNA polymerase